MSYTLLRSTWPAARKAYRCIWCGQAIPVGEVHRHEVSRYDGHFQDHRWRRHHTPRATEALLYDEEFTPYGNERPAPLVQATS